MGSWEEHQELLRAVSFEVRDESGSLPVEHVDEPHQSGYRGVTREAVVQLGGARTSPRRFDLAKGVAGGVALLGIGLLFGYGTFNYLSQVARELGALL